MRLRSRCHSRLVPAIPPPMIKTSAFSGSRPGYSSGGGAQNGVLTGPNRIRWQVDFESYDVLVVGGGLAGLRAGIAAVEANPRVRVGLVSKVYPMRSHTVSAEGGAAAALRPEDSYENHAFDTVKGSDYLADQDVVEAFVREAPIELIQMEHWGCPWSRDPDGKISARPFGGMTNWRTCFAADKTGFHIAEAVRGEGGYLLNNEGERFLKRYVPNKMELGPRDIISRAMMTEFEEGRGFEGPHGKYLHLDVRHLGEKVIDRKLPFMRELGREFVGIDIVKEPIPVRPVQHYMMGGVDADITGATPMAGLYAAGECANVGLNGANRLGSNSLSECLVFGAAAGRAAAEYASSAKPVTANPVDAILWDEARRGEGAHLQKKRGDERIGAVREGEQQGKDTGAGVFRTQEGFENPGERVGGLRPPLLR